MLISVLILAAGLLISSFTLKGKRKMNRYKIKLTTADGVTYPAHGAEPLYIEAISMNEAAEAATCLIRSKGITGMVKQLVIVREGV